MKQKLPVTFILHLLALAIFAFGCTPTNSSDNGQVVDPGGSPAENGELSGTITVRDLIDTIELPEGTVVTVKLEDVSLADAPSVVLAERTYTNIAQLPMSYELSYKLSDLNEGYMYSISAAIYDTAGRLLFINDTMHPVMTNEGDQEIDIELITVQPIVDEGGTAAEDGKLSGTITVRNMIDYIEIPKGATVTIKLEDVSLADAPSVVLAERTYTNIAQLPMSYELSYKLSDLNEGYMYSISAAIYGKSGDLLFINDTLHPVMANQGDQEIDIELIMIEPDTGGVTNGLDGSSWKLVAFSLNDAWVEALPDVEVTLEFLDDKIGGYAGCNRYFGSYVSDGETLVISALGATRKACLDADLSQQENLLLESLENAVSYSIEENALWIEYGENVALVFFAMTE